MWTKSYAARPGKLRWLRAEKGKSNSMKRQKQKIARRFRRHRRLRRRLEGTAQKPRLCVFRSLRHIYCQIVDDEASHTLAASSTLVKEIREKISTEMKKADTAVLVGEDIARRAKDAGIEKVVFDRGGFGFNGRIKALADAARKQGLKF